MGFWTGQTNLESYDSLTFYKGYYTSGGSTQLPQLMNVGSFTKYNPSSVYCKNTGFDGVDVSWSCTAYGLPKNVQMYDELVSCESVEGSPSYIYAGSCILKFKLHQYYNHQAHNNVADWSFLFFCFLFIFIIFLWNLGNTFDEQGYYTGSRSRNRTQTPTERRTYTRSRTPVRRRRGRGRTERRPSPPPAPRKQTNAVITKEIRRKPEAKTERRNKTPPVPPAPIISTERRNKLQLNFVGFSDFDYTKPPPTAPPAPKVSTERRGRPVVVPPPEPPAQKAPGAKTERRNMRSKTPEKKSTKTERR